VIVVVWQCFIHAIQIEYVTNQTVAHSQCARWDFRRNWWIYLFILKQKY